MQLIIIIKFYTLFALLYAKIKVNHTSQADFEGRACEEFARQYSKKIKSLSYKEHREPGLTVCLS
jgi:hypothetical protein